MLTDQKTSSRAVLLITLVALGLRVWAADRFSYWGDEQFSCDAVNNLREALHYLSYTLINRAVCNVFGMNYLVLRLVSVVYGTAAVVAMYLLVDLLAGRRAAIVAATMLCLSPLAIQLSSEIRNYSFFLLNILISAYLLERFIRFKSRKSLYLYFLHLPVLLTSHMLAILLPLVHAVRWLYTKDRRLFYGAAMLGVVGLIALIVAKEPLLRLIWPVIGGHQQNFVQTSQSRSVSLMSVVKAAQALYVFFFGYGVPVGAYSALASLVVLFVVLRNASLLRKHGVLVLWTVLPIAVVFLVVDGLAPGFFPAAQAKYALVALPPFLAILALASTASGRVLPAATLVALLAINTGLMFSGRYSQYSYYVTDYRSGLRKFADIDAFVVNGPNRFPLKTEAWKQHRAIRIIEPIPRSGLPDELVVVTGSWKPKDIAADNDLLARLHDIGYRAVDTHSSWNTFFFRMSRVKGPATYFRPRVGGIRYRHLQFPLKINRHTCLYYADLRKPVSLVVPQSRTVEVYYLLTAHPKHSRNVVSAIAQPTGERLSVGPLRDWRDPEGSVRSFYKPFDSVGTSAYPGAYSSFRAHIHKAEIVAKRPFTRIVLSASMPEDVAILGIRADGFDSEGRPQ